MRQILMGAVVFVMALLNAILSRGMLSTSIVKPVEEYSYDQLETDLSALEARFPRSLSVIEYGCSRDGRKLYAAIAGDISAKSAVLIQAGIHGREHMTITLVMSQLEYMLKRGVPKGVCFYMIPSSNPDGAFISQTLCSSPAIDAMYEADVAAGRFRRAKSDYLREWKANAAGVDLNRNFDAMWENIKTAPWPSYENYRGPYANSEPETKALVELTKSRCFDATISYHATGSEIYYEFGEDKEVNDMGYSLAVKVNKHLKYEIKPDSGTSFGGYKDWVIMSRKIPSLTIEIGKGRTPLSISEWKDIRRRNALLPYDVAGWVKDRGDGM